MINIGFIIERIEHLKNSNAYLKEEKSTLLILQGINDFVSRAKTESIHEVLNAFPGHGKTTALKQFVKSTLTQQNLEYGGLIVLREKEQMQEFSEFVDKKKILYVDSDNLIEVIDEINSYQFVLITHERLKNLMIRDTSKETFLYWRNQKRILFIDEMPIFFRSTVFKLNSDLSWLDECFKLLGEQISAAEIVMIRSYVQIMIAKEILENNTLRTNALHLHLESNTYESQMNRFIKMIHKKSSEFKSVEHLTAFLFFKDMYENPNVGFIDPIVHLNGFIDYKNIICSERIDYRDLGCSILIFDGTANKSVCLYNGEYKLITIPNQIDYTRLHLHHRQINTSAQKRKASTRVTVQQIIAKDIERIELENGSKPFPLMNKDEITKYRNLGVIDETLYKQYFEKRKEDKNPINILNTVGKNYLREQTMLYLTSLPNRPPEHYKAIAISLYKNDENTLNLSTLHKDKENLTQWFADARIEKIYHQVLLSEINQIIHRSKIRQLDSTELIHIFIATDSATLIAKIGKMFNRHKSTVTEIEQNLKFEAQLEEKACYVAKILSTQKITQPKRIGSIEGGSAIKSFINRTWKDNKEKIIEVFNRHGVTLIELPNKEKRVKLENNKSNKQ